MRFFNALGYSKAKRDYDNAVASIKKEKDEFLARLRRNDPDSKRRLILMFKLCDIDKIENLKKPQEDILWCCALDLLTLEKAKIIEAKY